MNGKGKLFSFGQNEGTGKLHLAYIQCRLFGIAYIGKGCYSVAQQSAT